MAPSWPAISASRPSPAPRPPGCCRMATAFALTAIRGLWSFSSARLTPRVRSTSPWGLANVWIRRKIHHAGPVEPCQPGDFRCPSGLDALSAFRRHVVCAGPFHQRHHGADASVRHEPEPAAPARRRSPPYQGADHPGQKGQRSPCPAALPDHRQPAGHAETGRGGQAALAGHCAGRAAGHLGNEPGGVSCRRPRTRRSR